MGGEDGFLLVISCLVTVLKIRTLMSSGRVDVNDADHNYLALLNIVVIIIISSCLIISELHCTREQRWHMGSQLEVQQRSSTFPDPQVEAI